MPLRIPVATYRLQLNAQFSLKQLLPLLPYFKQLGITDLYLSPLTRSAPGSMHGYDVVDYRSLNDEICTEQELEKFAAALQENKMGLLLDIVPNHMCISSSLNAWWYDVLENGPASPYADYFDIDWNPPKQELKNKILLPILEGQYGSVIENQGLAVTLENDAFAIRCGQDFFPLSPRTWGDILSPAVSALGSSLGEDDPPLKELQGLLTSLKQLPFPDVAEILCRENARIKERLAHLLQESPSIKKAVLEQIERINGKKEDPKSFDALEALLAKQSYRLSHWRVANDEINYRRFFDINQLAGIHTERFEVFSYVHELVLRLVGRGWVTGLRLDHIDGLYDPETYLYDLQHACYNALSGTVEGSNGSSGRDFYLVAEKVLIGEERLSDAWLVHGTTGYDFLNALNGLYVKQQCGERFRQLYRAFTNVYDKPLEVLYKAKKSIMGASMAAELYVLARRLDRISERYRVSRDFTCESLRKALMEIIAAFSVYRSYIRAPAGLVDDRDRVYVEAAVRLAKKMNPATSATLFDFIKRILFLEKLNDESAEEIAERNDFVMRFQQLTGAVMAKGLEDTAFYRYFPLASLNEVGGDLRTFGTSLATLHARNAERLQKWPATLNATSTHDSKRSEDVRARINVLSEIPDKWEESIKRWHEMTQQYRVLIDGEEAPDPNDEYLLYQTIFGTWPLTEGDGKQDAAYVDRIERYMLKAASEAKVNTSWISPNEQYVAALTHFVREALSRKEGNAFLEDFLRFVQPLVRPGLWNALSQVVIKSCSPGVPDFYQGSELWQFHLVDPDNRGLVDFKTRQKMLRAVIKEHSKDPAACVSALASYLEDGRLKMLATYLLLNLRREKPDLFLKGEYAALTAEGERAEHVIAFQRKYENRSVIVVSGRFFAELGEEWQEVWKGTTLLLPPGVYRDLLTGKSVEAKADGVPLTSILPVVPFAVLESC